MSPDPDKNAAGEEPIRALVVDDEPTVRQTIARFLVHKGIQVTEAEDGSEALSHLQKSDFDVVISDICMPGTDGIVLLRAVREKDLDLPVVLVTGHATLNTAKMAIEYGAFRYLEKPFQFEELAEVVHEAANLYRMARLKRMAMEVTAMDPELAGDQASLGAHLDSALESLWMAYQPIVQADGRLFGYEALMRTQTEALPHPGAVLSAAERLDRLAELGRIIRRRAPEPMTPEPERGLLFINLHPRDLLDPDLTAADTPLTRLAERVVLEITERASLEHVANVRKVIERLREMGFRIAVDDLGAGYAGLTSFATLKPEFVKIDMSLVRGVDTDPLKQRLIQSLTRVCADMGMLVVTEGIETRGERDAVIELGSDLLQGYLIGKPDKPFPIASF